nr:hypothetical protein [Tanacetum cinerariifolium]
MALTFTDTYIMIAFLTKSDASGGFVQVIDFLNASVINLVRNVDSLSKFYMYPRFLQLMIRAKVGAAGVNVDDVPTANAEPTIPPPTTQSPPPSQEPPSTLQVIPTPPPSPIAQPLSRPQQQQPSQPTHDADISLDLLHTLLETCITLTRKLKALEQDKRLKRVRTAQRVESYKDTVIDDISKYMEIIANMDADEDVTLKDVAAVAKEVEVLSMQDNKPEPAKLKEVVEVVTTAKLMTKVVTAAAATITAVATAAPTITNAPSAARKRKGVDEAYARELEVELNRNINWDEVIEHVKEKGKQDNDVLRYQALKRKPQTEAHARKNMMIYLKNMAGFKLDYFKERLEEEVSRALKRKDESSEEKADKKQKLDEEATPLALKVPVVDYEIYSENNKPYYKIKRADGSHQLYLSFLSLLRNFDREDLESQTLQSSKTFNKSPIVAGESKELAYLYGCGRRCPIFDCFNLDGVNDCSQVIFVFFFVARVDENIIDEHYHKFIQGAHATGAAPGVKSIWNSTWRIGGRLGGSLRKTSGNSLTTVLGLVAHLVTSLTLNSARSCMMQGASFTQGKVFSIHTVFSWGGSISPGDFLRFIMLSLVIIIAVVVVVAVIMVVVVVGEGVSPSRVFLLALSAFSMVAAYASKAAVTLSTTSFLMAA